jgi:predicted TIM-barrel fold metal-dependent hydrolase
MLVQEYGVWNKLLFGTDYPFTTVEGTLAGLRGLCQVKLDRFSLDAGKVEEVIHRDALPLLGLAD